MCAWRLERLHLKGASTLFTQRVAAWMHGGMKNFFWVNAGERLRRESAEFRLAFTKYKQHSVRTERVEGLAQAPR
jgi:hypothetical protein